MFKNGNNWIRIDLHLHTISDSEFKYSGSSFEKDYISALDKAGIKIAAITNHNKFEKEEFLRLSKLAKEKNIWLLPGVELEVKDGKRGLHTLFIFDEKDIDFIESFIHNNYNKYDDEKNKNLGDVIKFVEERKKEYILILAHVENNKGFFKELSPANYHSWIKQDYFRNKILALQDANKSSVEKFENEIRKIKKGEYKNSLPAYVSFIDAKSIDDIVNKDRKTYVKLGEFNFEALRFAFLNHFIRISLEKKDIIYPRILSLKIDGEFVNNTLYFNNSLNTLIGVRGSGKSTIIELLRWGLGLSPLKHSDDKYKDALIKNALGSAGEVEIEIVAQNGEKYLIKRNIIDFKPRIYNSDEKININLDELFKVFYFGQKDLSMIVKDNAYRLNFFDEFIDLKELKEKEEKILNELKNELIKLKNLEISTSIEEIESKINAIVEKLKLYKDLKVSDLLQEQKEFNRDKEIYKHIKNAILEIKKELENLFSLHKESFDSLSEYDYKFLKNFKSKFLNLKEKYFLKQKEMLQIINEFFISLNEEEKIIENNQENFSKKLSNLKEKLGDVDTKEFLNMNRELEKLKIIKKDTENKQKLLADLKNKIDNLIERLLYIRKEIFKKRESFANEINKDLSFLKVKFDFISDVDDYIEFLINIFKGHNIRKQKIEEIARKYKTGYELVNNYNDDDKIRNIIKEKFNEILPFIPKDRVIIEYKVNLDYKELEKLSLGQRAATILALLLYNAKYPIIIDQPEDDIDNSTIYEGIIKNLLSKKDENQFIFATHNSNIVVLGDSDEVFVCKNENEKLSLTTGSIDKKEIQKEIINIMEGGKEAFMRRKDIYKVWK